MKVNNREVGKRIKSIRMALGMTLEEFGERIDKTASKSNVNHWEAGRSIPKPSRIKRIAEIGNISTDELLYGKQGETHELVFLEDYEKEVLNLFRSQEMNIKEYLELQDEYINDLEHLNSFYHEKIQELLHIRSDMQDMLLNRPIALKELKKATTGTVTKEL
ncbi:helix-turn-helix domain-containing protein [Atopococcus tabaci]|uniref:helix-turn-helix domain-containing protein n=1 Tax=Atopococcus tabaci TaxID=269774 RepID=UPI00240A45C5|nr:helix-turn-helix transcriptional regulator [Atopococcus tabaci]